MGDRQRRRLPLSSPEQHSKRVSMPHLQGKTQTDVNAAREDPAAADERDVGAAPVPRASGTRGDFAVVAELLPYLRPYLGRIILALGLILAAKLVNLLVPFALKKIVDQLNVKPTLLMLPVALLLAYGAGRIGVTLFTELRQVVFARVLARASRHITLKVFRHLHELSLKFQIGR